MKLKWIVAILAAGAIVAPAYALSDKQLAGLSHVGQVAAATQICSTVELNSGVMAFVMVGLDLDLKDPLQAELVRRKATEAIDAWKEQDENAACLAVMMLYGPDGANVPGLLKWKK